ncbi:MAG: ATP phosphoribosyltransferase regulatory subunit [Clostridia bacterium]|nr:ATP phosphoribosyltransferase regulatory subunit [Clostridia bacterium]
MKEWSSVLKNEELAVLELRRLYRERGYAQFKMSKFEEYELYVRNKNFLVSDHVITFTDAGGKLMALKPDVTLSIVKNSKLQAGCVQRLYYDEKVYRASRTDHSFREIPQVGLECLGDIDDFAILEVLTLAAKSLACISEDYVLDISHLGLLSALLDAMPLSDTAKDAIVSCIGEKNLHGILKICEDEGICAEQAEDLRALVSTYGPAERVLPILEARFGKGEAAEALGQLRKLCRSLSEMLPAGCIRLDFSVVSDLNYYNGIVFKGFIKGIPSGILSGGQYDKLMSRMGKRAGAVGFAVYLDLLEELYRKTGTGYDVDVLLLYSDADAPGTVQARIDALIGEGYTVSAQKSCPEKLKYRTLVRMNEKEGAKQ